MQPEHTFIVPPLGPLGAGKRGSVCVGVFLHNVTRADSVHVLSMPRADFHPRAETLDVCCWFVYQIWTRHTWNPGIAHKIMGGSLNLPLALKLFLKSFYTWMKVRSWSKFHTWKSALRMLSADHLNIDGPRFPVKIVRKFRSALGGEVACRCVCVCVCVCLSVCVCVCVYNIGLQKRKGKNFGKSQEFLFYHSCTHHVIEHFGFVMNFFWNEK